MRNKEIKLCEIKNFNCNIPENILEELQMYTGYRVENEDKGNQIIQRFYVNEDEFKFYKEWKEKIINDLQQSTRNAVLIKNIARRHGFK